MQAASDQFVCCCCVSGFCCGSGSFWKCLVFNAVGLGADWHSLVFDGFGFWQAGPFVHTLSHICPCSLCQAGGIGLICFRSQEASVNFLCVLCILHNCFARQCWASLLRCGEGLFLLRRCHCSTIPYIVTISCSACVTKF